MSRIVLQVHLKWMDAHRTFGHDLSDLWRAATESVMAQSTALKDYINRAAVRKLGEQIQNVYPEFALDRFVTSSCRGLTSLEFTQRTRRIAAVLQTSLPPDMPRALAIIGDCLPEPLPYSDGMFSENFWLWPLSDFVRDYGTEHWDEALDACYQLTQCFTAEFAVRPQLERHPERTLKLLRKWTKDPSEHVRRLCSEGTRPRLPWAPRLELPRKLVQPILVALKQDPSRFVQKSVANHLNDLGKDDSAWLLRTMKPWSKSRHQSTQWIVRHALRSHIKQGDPVALEMLGYTAANLEADLTITPKRVPVGGKITARLEITSDRRTPQRLLIDWVMHYIRPGRQPYRKVFKGKAVDLDTVNAFVWEKTFDMSARNTRSLYPGMHRLEVQANGQVATAAEFRLTK